MAAAAGDPIHDEHKSWDELLDISPIPSEFFFKFRKELHRLRFGLNLQFYNVPANEYHTKLTFKPMSPERKWKLVYEPNHHDVRIISKKIPISKYLNLQVGIGHSFQLHSTGWKWKITTCWGGDGISKIQNKTSLGLLPGMDFRFCWRADYVLPEITGGVGGEDEPLFNMKSGRLRASLDRVELILTHKQQENNTVKSDYIIA